MANIFEYKDNLHVMDHIPAILKWGSLEGPKPDVSILMPVYNHPHYFKIAIETALRQDYEGAYEIVVLDNNMEDDVNNINEFENYIKEKKDLRIIYYKNEHNIQGINSYNRLPQLARADYFTFLHDDDELTCNCLSELMKIKSEKCLSKELIVSSKYYIDKDSKIVGRTNSISYGALWKRCYKMNMFDWFLKNHTNGCGTLHNKEAFLEIGGYCSDYIPTADYAFYSLYAYKYGSIKIKKSLFKYRIAENDTLKVYKDCVKMCIIIKKDIIPLINIPSRYLNIVIKAQEKWNLERQENLFGMEKSNKASFIDKFFSSSAVAMKLLYHMFLQ